MSRILIIRSNSISPDPRVDKEARSLSKAGHSVEVLAWDRQCNEIKFEDRRNYKIHRMRIKANCGDLSVLFPLIIWMLNEAKFLLSYDYDIIHSCDLDTLIPAVIISKIKKKPLVYDCFDLYADCLPVTIPKAIRRAIYHLEKFLAKQAKFCILADESRKEQFDNDLNNVIIINNSPINLEKVNINKNYESCQFEEEDFKILYAGLLDKHRGIEQILKIVMKLDNIKLIIAGFGVDEYEISKLCKLTIKAKFLGKINYDEVLRLSYKCDLLIALYDPIIPNHKYASPNKLFEAMMCSKPIIVNEGNTMADIVRKERCGIVVPYGDINALKNAIMAIKNDKALRFELGNNGRKAYKQKYNWEIMEKRLIFAYKTIEKIPPK